MKDASNKKAPTPLTTPFDHSGHVVIGNLVDEHWLRHIALKLRMQEPWHLYTSFMLHHVAFKK